MDKEERQRLIAKAIEHAEQMTEADCKVTKELLFGFLRMQTGKQGPELKKLEKKLLSIVKEIMGDE